jgi:hypothetical protein
MLRLVSAGSIEEFQWSTNEQVWPFERGKNGETLYCKEIEFGTLPSAGIKYVAHDISAYNRLFRADAILEDPGAAIGDVGDCTMDRVHPANLGFSINLQVDNTHAKVRTGGPYDTVPAEIRLIYYKSS